MMLNREQHHTKQALPPDVAVLKKKNDVAKDTEKHYDHPSHAVRQPRGSTDRKQSLATLRVNLAELNLEYAAAKTDPRKVSSCDEYDRIEQSMRASEQDLHKMVKALKHGTRLESAYPSGARVAQHSYRAHAQMLVQHVDYLVYEFHEQSNQIHQDFRFELLQRSTIVSLWQGISKRTLKLFEHPVRDSRGVLNQKQHRRAVKMAVYDVAALLSRLDFLDQDAHSLSKVREEIVQLLERLKSLRAKGAGGTEQNDVVNSAEDEASQPGEFGVEVPILMYIGS